MFAAEFVRLVKALRRVEGSYPIKAFGVEKGCIDSLTSPKIESCSNRKVDHQPGCPSTLFLPDNVAANFFCFLAFVPVAGGDATARPL